VGIGVGKGGGGKRGKVIAAKEGGGGEEGGGRRLGIKYHVEVGRAWAERNRHQLLQKQSDSVRNTLYHLYLFSLWRKKSGGGGGGGGAGRWYQGGA